MLGLTGAGIRQAMMLGPSRLDWRATSGPAAPTLPTPTQPRCCFQHLALVTDDAAGAWARGGARGRGPDQPRAVR